ncbi:MAG: PA0069 family radical SAM protein [Cytophagales bacterium]|uniref:PA0069 family radical SAM protein n=1 Tax=Cyclobacterium marinum TaxID=104 RepID=UPI0030DBD09C|nr:PA0069 family radical SAM protein [Cytophagales bacterium]|tara:strand:+ start:203497 stop:204555 length:1059 start_codon:yes stop_codon:yes gene_type:complete
MKGASFKGRGTSQQPGNVYEKNDFVQEHIEGVDLPIYEENPRTKFIKINTKSALSVNDSPDLPLSYSINPYQGCEHGCIYCYARNSHQYWGYDSGLGFETNILVKANIIEQLKRQFEKPTYQAQAIMLSGNTDCYQPAESKFKLTKKVLETCLEYKHPVSIITKNSLIERDFELLKKLASKNLVHVYLSINHLDNELKLLLEPRTAIAGKKIEIIRKFSTAGIPIGIMVAPIIPGINTDAIPEIIKSAAKAGAKKVGYTVVRLNGQVKDLFHNWLLEHFPDRAEKVMHQIEALHGGNVNDSDWGRRLKGEGVLAQTISDLVQISIRKHLPKDAKMPAFDFSQFIGNGQTKLF